MRTFVQKSMLIFFIVIIAAFSALGKEKPLATAVAENEIAIDGLAADWGGIALTFMEKQNAAVGMSLDSNYLYVLFRTNDEKYARMIKMGGLKITIDPKNKDAYRLAFDYRGGPVIDKRPDSRGDDAGRGMPAERQGRFPAGNDSGKIFSCAVGEKGEPLDIPIDGRMGPKAAYALENGLHTYEFAFPLKPSRAGFVGLGISPPQELKIEVVWNELDIKNLATGEGSWGMPGGGGDFGRQRPGGPSGGGMSGGPGGPGSKGDFEKPFRQKIRIKTVLPPLDGTGEK